MNCHQLRVVFAGTPEFALEALQAVFNSPHRLLAVYTQPDRPSGRGRKLSQSPVKRFALERGIPVYQPDTFKDRQTQSELASLEPDIMVVAAYGLILPVSVLNIPTLGCINIHASLLPRWRGAAPIQRAIEAGDPVSGVTIMQMARGLDTGDMLLKRPVNIELNTTARQLHDALAQMGGRAVLEVLPKLCQGMVQAEAQDDSHATYADKIEKRDARIDWRLPALRIHKKICAFNPFPVAYTYLDDKAVRIWDSELCAQAHDSGAQPGEVIEASDDGIRVATGDGQIRLLALQLPGKKPLQSRQFLNGCPLDGKSFV